MQSIFSKAAISTIIGIICLSCGSSGKRITRQDYGDKWPFTTEEGYLDCDGKEVTFTSNGITYSLTGLAKGPKFHQIEEIWALDEVRVKKVLAEGVDTAYSKPLKGSIMAIINDGAKLCK